MRREAKQFLSYLLAMVMLVSMVPTQIFATEEIIVTDHEHENVVMENPLNLGVDPSINMPVIDSSDDLMDVGPTESELVSGGDVVIEEIATGPAVGELEETTESAVVEGEIFEDLMSEDELHIRDLINEMSRFLTRYAITDEMSDVEMEEAIWNLDDEGFDTIAEIEEKMNNAPILEGIEFTEEEQTTVETYGRFCGVLEQMNSVSFFAASGNHTPLTGITVGVSGATDNSMSDNVVTVNVKGSNYSAKTATITITNTLDHKVNVSFDWTADNVNELKINSLVKSGNSGTVKEKLAPGEKINLTVKAAKKTTSKIQLSSFNVSEIENPEQYTVDLSHNLELGIITVNGNNLTDSGITVSEVWGTTLVATPKNGSKFLAWVDSNTNEILSKDLTYNLIASKDMNIKVAFANPDSTPWFTIKGATNYLYDDLEKAQNKGNEVVLVADGTLKGDYTIYSGKTLLIPFDDAYTIYKDEPAEDSKKTWAIIVTIAEEVPWEAPREKRTLYMASGASITVKGSVSLSAKHHAGGSSSPYTGSPTGDVSFIRMATNSSIILENTGALYAWGYITGNGTIEAKEGSVVYENFQFVDFRGGSHSTQDAKDIRRVFPLSQYYIQNIEVPLTVNYGASVYCVTSVIVSKIAESGDVKFISDSDSLFCMTSGSSITLQYDGTRDRLVANVKGNIELSNLSLDIDVSGMGLINSNEYVLPINSNMTINLLPNSEVTVSQDISLLPGAEINIQENAKCILNDNVEVYVYDEDDWDQKYVNTRSDIALEDRFIPLAYAPGRTYTRTDQLDIKDAVICVNGTLDASKGNLYTTQNGGHIYSEGEGKILVQKVFDPDGDINDNTLYTYQVYRDDTSSTYFRTTPIVITQAQLKERDGTCLNSFPESADVEGFYEVGGVITYQYNAEKGKWIDTHVYNTSNVCFVCGETMCDINGHSWSEATCTEPQKCTCGATTGSALGHEVVTEGAIEPTCTTDGVSEWSYCGRTGCEITFVERETVPATGHTWNEATCTESQKCTCGATTGSALGHIVVTDGAVEATCTTDGKTEGSHCDRCKVVIVEQQTTPATGHDWADATCTEPQKCTCGATTGSALGHEIVTDAAVSATCTASGLTVGYHCDRCNEVLTAQNIEDPLGHHVVTDEAIEATCTSTGLTLGTHCDRCKVVLEAQTVINKTAHTRPTELVDCKHPVTCAKCGFELESQGDHIPVPFDKIDAVCESSGTEAGIKCFACNIVISGGAIIPALGHEVVTKGAIKPTCIEDGASEWSYCGRTGCGITLVEKETVSATGHTWSDATCTEPQKCTCGATTGSALGHEVVTEGAIEPTCTTDGVSEWSYCGRTGCGITLVEKETVPATGHTWSGATCTEPQKCTCGATTGSALGHEVVTVGAIEPTCTIDGVSEWSHCGRTGCGITLVEKETVPATGHTWSGATCTEPQKCTCGVTTGSALGHEIVTDAAVKETCTQAGFTEGTHCKRCGEVFVAQETIVALGHKIVNHPDKQPTCDVPGYRFFKTCERCDYTSKIEIEPLGHSNLVYHEGKDPTYTQNGWKPYYTCSRYGCEYNTYEAIPPLGNPEINTYAEFLDNLVYLEELARDYVKTNPGKDPIALIIKYIRTGVERYNSGSWGIMAGYEDLDFADYVRRAEDEYNSSQDSIEKYRKASGLKNITEFTLPNGDVVDFGHMFGTMDITHHNKGSQNHADVGGWAGDLVDLMSASDRAYNNATDSSIHFEVPSNFEAMVDQIRNYIFLESTCWDDKFNRTDYYGDIDALYVMTELYKEDYTAGDMTAIIRELCTEDLSDEDRAVNFLKIRFGYQGTRSQVREEVYNAYSANKTITTLESTRDFLRTDAAYLEKLRRAVCYAFADYICEMGGDFVDVESNPYYTDFYSESSTLAPGITYEKHKATSADDKQMVYYIATADLSNPYVSVKANYTNADPTKWEMGRVLDQANAAQAKYGDPESEHYIPNYQIVVSTNSDGFNMTTGEPGGLLIMDGKEWHPIKNDGFFGITKEGEAVIGFTKDYNEKYKGQLSDAVGAFGTMLVKDGKIAVTATSNYYSSRASRTAVGITKTGKVVVMVLDGRQEPVSCGGSMEEIAQIMLEAGCYQAVNLDGGGSTTFVSKPEGKEELEVTNVPSDGFARSVSSTLIFVSTAPSSTAFDHARLESDYDYATIGTQVQIEAVGVSATGNVAEIPEGCVWSVSDNALATITEDGKFQGIDNGTVDVILSLEGEEVGRKTMNVVVPTNVYFTRQKMDVVYGSMIKLPVAALYNGKNVAITENDVMFSSNPANAGTFNGYQFTANESSTKVAKLTVSLVGNAAVNGLMTVNLYEQGENTFDFDKATAGDRLMAWDRQVTNSVTSDNMTYNAVDPEKNMETSYIFAMDMSQIPVPERLSDLVFMLPGADAEDASAWNFLLQLAERVSVLTEVTPVITIDPRFDVDYSQLAVMNEYFVIKNRDEDITFDPATNQLTLKLHWVDQTQAIDPNTANPLCLMKGLKLIPKDGTFDGTERITVNNKAVISYKIYLRASALYSFAQKEENQQIFGLKPFTSTYNDNGVEKPESGGYFENEYKRIEDSYTLSYAKLNGWVHAGTGYEYYVNGEKLTGVQLIDGYYYDFSENGINVGRTKFTGVFEDVGGLKFIRVGVPVTPGWHTDKDKTYHVHEDGFAYLAKVDNPMTCIRGGYNTYTCLESTCKKVETVGDFQTPKGHDWDENHVCRKCEFVGIDITSATFGFGTLAEPVNIAGVVRYYYSKGGVRPYVYATFDGKTELSWSGDGNVDKYGFVKDLYVTWPNNTGIGKAFVEITGRGNYYGKYTLEYQIIPRDVKNLRAESVTDTAVTLVWDKAEGADRYYIYRYQDGLRTYIATTTDTRCEIIGINEGEVYHFQIAAAAESTDGENKVYTCANWSNVVTIPEGAAPPVTPQPAPTPNPRPSGGGGSTVDAPVYVQIKNELEPTIKPDRNGKVEFQVGNVAIKNGVQDAIANEESTVEVKPVISGDAKEVITVISKDSVKELKSNDVGVAVSSPVAGITVKSEALKLVDGDLELTAVKNNDGTVTISTTVDGKAKDLKDVTVTIPFGKNVAEKDNKFNVLVEVHEDGTETVIKKSVVDSDGVAAIVDSNATVKVAQVEKEFPDTEGHWGESAIDFVAARGIFSGTGKGFEPNGTMTRAMIVTTLYHLEDATARGTHSFPDVPSGTWYSDPVTWAARERIVSGTGKGFEPNVNITRQQLAVILYNYAKYVGMDTSARGDLAKYNDKAKVAGWAAEAMEWAIGSGLISGMGNNTLNPQGNATRAQAAVIYEKLIKQMVKN